MNEDKRKNARTQGRYSGSDKELCSKGQDKEKHKGSKTASDNQNKDEERKNLPENYGSKAPRGIKLKYDADGEYSGNELYNRKRPVELSFSGLKVISETDNGVSRLMYDPDFMSIAKADELFTILLDSTTWSEKNIVVNGKKFLQPRLVAWYGPYPYSYAGATLDAKEMPKAVLEIKRRVEEWLRNHGIVVDLNSVLLNLYRDRSDSVSWHSDDEISLGICPTIASVSLGETRKFLIRPKHPSMDIEDVSYVNLTHGSLIVMDGCMQKDWQHKVPKEFHDKKERINLTFRTIYPLDQLPPEMPRVTNVKSTKSSDVKVAHEQEYNMGTENFPPLGWKDSDKKNKSQTGNTCYPSASYGNSQKEENLNLEVLNVECTEETLEIENDLNSVPVHDPVNGSPELYPEHTDLNSNAASGSSIYNNSSNNKFSYWDSTDNQHHTETNQSNDYNPNTLGNKPIEMDAESASSNKKSALNADAPDFIPTVPITTPLNKFEEYSLSDLAEYGYHVGHEDLQSFLEEIFNRFHTQYPFFDRDIQELDVYHDLVHVGSMSHSHLQIISDRICFMIMKALQKKEHNSDEDKKNYLSRPSNKNNHRKPKPSHEDNYHKPKPSHEDNYHKPKPSHEDNYHKPKPFHENNYHKPKPFHENNYHKPRPSHRGNYNKPKPTHEGNYHNPKPSYEDNYNKPTPSQEDNSYKPSHEDNYHKPKPSHDRTYHKHKPSHEGNYSKNNARQYRY